MTVLLDDSTEGLRPPGGGTNEWPLLAGGRWATGTATEQVSDPDTGDVVADVAMAGELELEAALAAAVRAVHEQPWPGEDRALSLAVAAQGLSQAGERFAELIATEGVKTIREARAEVTRAVHTLRLSAAAALAPHQLAPPVPAAEVSARTMGWRGQVRSGPIGVVAAITPYNDPLNLVVHKVGPALAAGNAVIVKPDPRTPLTALLLAWLLLEHGVPAGRLSVLPAGPDITSRLVADPRVRFVSFTGGRVAGAAVQRAAGVKPVLMELGGICPTLLLDDVDLDLAVPDVLVGAYAAAGQNCLHVQRLLIHRSVYEQARDRLVSGAEQMRGGPKKHEDSDMGPLIDPPALRRVGRLVDQARSQGARVLTGGSTHGPRYLPTLLEQVPEGAKLAREEIFGPVTTLEPFDTLQEAIALANRTGGGIHAGVFTQRREAADLLSDALDVGGVVLGGSSDHRSDAMPFGGTGAAGGGREGITYATAAMTQTKTLLSLPHT